MNTKKPETKSPTGRLTTASPPMQNIPLRTPEGQALRKALLLHLQQARQ